ncbi:hypothetical protein JF544_18710 [Halobacillus kuroshimensis]|uniref:Uncharacterized protein n=1 Tax=Halobacillus kuroshimensis TaxID=302481 RepID=A0ABS3E115_9BACI|nr:hypothetical protein [Halobacillus kuroshimensis]MBN8237281.1 hypothetical protein [Halobacillus kuroshimensis]
MSRFVKGTSILGIALLGFGVWQLTEMDRENHGEAESAQTIIQQDQSYEKVFIEQGNEEEENRPDYERVDNQMLRTIEDNDEMKELVSGLGKGVTEDLNDLEAETEEQWKTIEEDTKQKKQMLKRLIELTDDKKIEQIASSAEAKLDRMMEDKKIDFYKEAVLSFQLISERLS